ncbi:MAG TPA: glycosyltransferase [Gammaproteobacteria bacterium]|nr:glycosyltransferase [Gammaproteobacteria bacterium]HET7586575.1 glycosyltransferase [Gammaproteobacteria bacterium]
MIAAILAGISVAIWWGILLAPWRPWSTRERLDAGVAPAIDLSGLTVLIPARDEADVLPHTLVALSRQGDPHVIVIDDQSSDATAAVAAAGGAQVLSGAALPNGWTGKLWALEQGRREAKTRWLLLLDADIELQPGALAALLEKAAADGRQFVSVMARLRMQSVWERLLMPAFIYFFKLLYPFALANSARRWIAAAAGGCVLVEANVLTELGGFGAIRDAVIDDCALARAVKSRGYRTWIGLSKAVVSRREYPSLGSIGEMVARTAFTQLRYSSALLALCTLALALACWMPIAGLFWPASRWLAVAAWVGMAASYIPTLRFYGRSSLWALAMPLIGTLYLAMTWQSAWRYWRGVRSRWKNREYSRQAA